LIDAYFNIIRSALLFLSDRLALALWPVILNIETLVVGSAKRWDASMAHQGGVGLGLMIRWGQNNTVVMLAGMGDESMN
jgi:hypothetical protein